MFDGEIARVSCMCGGEEIAVSSDDRNGEIDLAFWAVGRGSCRDPYGLTYKIRQVLGILRDGHPYADMVILNIDEAQKLRSALGYAITKAIAGKKKNEEVFELSKNLKVGEERIVAKERELEDLRINKEVLKAIRAESELACLREDQEAAKVIADRRKERETKDGQSP